MLGPSGTRPRTFHPTFTYPIFGDAETIYGYKGLSLDLSFAAWDFRAYLKVRWDEKIENSPEIEAEKVEEPLLNYLPEGDTSSFSKLLTPQKSSFATKMISNFTWQIHLSICLASKSIPTLWVLSTTSFVSRLYRSPKLSSLLSGSSSLSFYTSRAARISTLKTIGGKFIFCTPLSFVGLTSKDTKKMRMKMPQLLLGLRLHTHITFTKRSQLPVPTIHSSTPSLVPRLLPSQHIVAFESLNLSFCPPFNAQVTAESCTILS